MKKSASNIQINIVVLIVGFLFFCLIIGRLVYLNLSDTIDGINLKEFAKNRNTTKEILYAKRGTIYDKNEEVLAETVDSYTVVAFLDESRSKNQIKPRHVIDKQETAEKLSPLINMSVERIYGLLDQKGLYQVELGPGGRGLSELQKDNIEKLGLPGIEFVSSKKRYYPNQDFSSYIIGYVVNDEKGNFNGEMGIESKYNDYLTGVNGSVTYQQDANGYKLVNMPEIRIEKEDGYDVYLTIDSNVQLMAERAMKNLVNEAHPESAVLVIAEAKTGKLIASSTYPSFDPNEKNITNYLNPLVSIPFEPGSTMKTYAYMTAMEKGTYKGDDTYYSGTMEVSNYTIQDWNRWGWGQVSYDFGYEVSSNIGIANLVTKNYITGEDLLSYYKKLGFGEKTGIELGGEVSGNVQFKYDVEVINAGFGQGVMTTPIQHIKALTAISNDGYLLNPTIVEKVIDPNTGEIIYQNKEQKGTKVASIETVNKMKDLMEQVVISDSGTGYQYRMEGYDIIGKTGTAEIFNPQTGQYYSSDYQSYISFAGMYPKNDTKYIFYIACKNIASSKYTADAIKALITDIEAYYNLTKVRSKENTSYKVSNFINKKVEDVKTELNTNGIKYEIIGDGDKVINQYPSKGNYPSGKVLLLTNGTFSESDLKGMSSKTVSNYCKLVGISCKLNGTGYVNNYTYEKDDKGNYININIELSQKYELN